MNIAIALRNEIVRLARKELRTETKALKRAVATYRSEIAALKRRTQELEKQLQRLGRSQAAAAGAAEAPQADAAQLRFSAKGLAALRRRLGLSANDLGRLVGVSGQSIYNWESGQIRPRAAQIAQIAGLRTIGKKKLAQRLEALGSGA